MPPAIAQFWNKLNANEKMVMYGAIIAVVAFLLGAVGGGGYFGSGSGDLIAAIIVTVIYWLKYGPNKINWPAPPQTIVLVVAGIAAIFAILALLGWISFIGISLFSLAILLNAVGCGIMAYGAWKEYQAMPKTTAAPPSSSPPAPPAA